MTFGKVIFGDNQFLGVNHSNQTKASELFEKVQKLQYVIDVLFRQRPMPALCPHKCIFEADGRAGGAKQG